MPYARLADRAVLMVTGEPAEDFLQTLITPDLGELGPDEVRPGALLTPQGKILYDFLVSRTRNGLRLDCAASIADELRKRLLLYRLRTKASIEASDEPVLAVWDEAPIEGAARDRRFADGAVFRLYGEAPQGIEEGDAVAFEELRIRAGVAEAATDYPTGEVFPHDILMDQNGGVSFRKGCFVGQEVVSRMQHRGTARRRLMLLAAERHLTPGANIESDGKVIGTVIAATGCDGFGLVRIDRLGAALARDATISADGVPLEATVPPWAGYDIPSGEASASGTDG